MGEGSSGILLINTLMDHIDPKVDTGQYPSLIWATERLRENNFQQKGHGSFLRLTDWGLDGGIE